MCWELNKQLKLFCSDSWQGSQICVSALLPKCSLNSVVHLNFSFWITFQAFRLETLKSKQDDSLSISTGYEPYCEQIQFVTELISFWFVFSANHQFTADCLLMMSTSTAQLTIIPFNSKHDSFRIWKIKGISSLKSLKLYSVLVNESISNDQSTALNESTVKSVNVKSSSESTADQTVKFESESSASQTIMNEKVKCFLIMCLDLQLLAVIQNLSDESTTANNIWNQLTQRFECQVNYVDVLSEIQDDEYENEIKWTC